MTNTVDAQVLGLSRLAGLSRRVRQAESFVETAFIAVNEARQLLEYRQAALWTPDKGVIAISGLPSLDGNVPFIQFLTALLKAVPPQTEPTTASMADFPPALTRDWSEWLPSHVMFCPLTAPQHPGLGLLFFCRDEPFSEYEIEICREFASIFGHGLAFHIRRPPWWRFWFQKRFRLASGLLLLAIVVSLLAVPVPLSVLAPVEVVAMDPFLVRSPLDGVIDHFHVLPNEPVQEGQLLFELERTNLLARLDLAEKAYSLANEEYRQMAQRAVDDDRAKAEIKQKKGIVEARAAELAYAREMLGRAAVKSPRAGVAIFTDPGAWVGKGVTLGEKMLEVADPAKVEMRIHLPVTNVMELAAGARVILYLNTDPRRPRKGVLKTVSYRPEVSPAGIVAYRLKADFAESETLPRIGLSGTARIYGESAPLFYAILRRPWTALRQWAGW